MLSHSTAYRRPFPAVLAVLGLVLALVLLPAPAARAAAIVVNTTSDELNSDGDCSLREAIEAANLDQPASGCVAGSFPDIITLPAGNYVLTTGRGLRISNSVTINGAGADTTIVDGNAGTGRVLTVLHYELLVCDSSNDRVLRFDPDTGALTGNFIAGGSGGLDMPGALTFGSDGRAYVAGFSSGVQRYNANGSAVDTFVAPGSGGLLGPTDLEFGPGGFGSGDPDDNLYVTKYQPNGAVLRYNRSSGAFIDTFISDNGSGGPITPNSLAWGDDDRLYLTDTASFGAVRRYNGQTGTYVSTFVAAGSGGLDTPRGLAFGPGGDLFVASEGNDRVLRYNGSTGTYVSTFVAAGSGGLDQPTDIAFGPDGYLYVVSKGSDEVLRYDGSSGAFVNVAAQAVSGIGLPACIAFSSSVGNGPLANITGVTVRNGAGGGIFVGERASLGLYRGVVRDNRSLTGGGIANGGSITIRDSTISNNDGGARAGGVANSEGASATIERTTITDNVATGGAGMVNSGDLELLNVTISGNSAGIRGGGITNTGVAHVASTTITDNEVTRNDDGVLSGGGVNNSGTFHFWNSIIAGNRDNVVGAGASPDCAGELRTERRNVVGNNANCTIEDGFADGTPFDRIGTPASPLDARLLALADNGGLTRTHALLSASPAVDWGSTAPPDALFACPARDQREALRPADGDGDGTPRCDSGAYEYAAAFPVERRMVLPLVFGE